MERTRIQLADGVYLTYLPARKFKTSLLSAQFVTPLRQETASAYALLPAILRRGTVRYPDLGALSARLDRLYGTPRNFVAALAKGGLAQQDLDGLRSLLHELDGGQGRG